jgi:hypothetical protein
MVSTTDLAKRGSSGCPARRATKASAIPPAPHAARCACWSGVPRKRGNSCRPTATINSSAKPSAWIWPWAWLGPRYGTRSGRHGVRVTTGGTAHVGAHGVVQRLPGAVLAPSTEVGPGSSPGHQVAQDYPPLGAAAGHVADGIEYLAKVSSGASKPFSRRQERLQDRPLCVADIAWITGCEACLTMLEKSPVPFLTPPLRLADAPGAPLDGYPPRPESHARSARCRRRPCRDS